MTPLHVAVKYARIQIVEFLTCQEATDVNIQDHKKVTVKKLFESSKVHKQGCCISNVDVVTIR